MPNITPRLFPNLPGHNHWRACLKDSFEASLLKILMHQGDSYQASLGNTGVNRVASRHLGAADKAFCELAAESTISCAHLWLQPSHPRVPPRATAPARTYYGLPAATPCSAFFSSPLPHAPRFESRDLTGFIYLCAPSHTSARGPGTWWALDNSVR